MSQQVLMMVVTIMMVYHGNDDDNAQYQHQWWLTPIFLILTHPRFTKPPTKVRWGGSFQLWEASRLVTKCLWWTLQWCNVQQKYIVGDNKHQVTITITHLDMQGVQVPRLWYAKWFSNQHKLCKCERGGNHFQLFALQSNFNSITRNWFDHFQSFNHQNILKLIWSDHFQSFHH